MRDRYLQSCLLILLLSILAGCARLEDAPAGARLFDGQGALVVYHSRTAAPEELRVAEDLARVLSTMSGHEVQVRREPWFGGAPGIYVGQTARLYAALPEWRASLRQETGPSRPFQALRKQVLPVEQWDTFRILAQGGSLIVAGADAKATELGVYWFLQNYGGVRWWMPGPEGEFIPQRAEWELGLLDIAEGPDFSSRQLWWPKNEQNDLWARRNLLRHQSHHNHNLGKIIPNRLADTHPELFPYFGGKRWHRGLLPTKEPHPNLLHPEVARRAAEAAQGYFEKNPKAPMFSVSLDDHANFGDPDQYGSLGSFRGSLDFSPPVFTFTNEVARQVAEEYPDRFIAALAYALWENTPGFPVEPNVLPVLAADRSGWYDPAFRKSDIELAQAWGDSGASIFGVWDYYYGHPYLVPRIFLKSQAESVRMLHDAGARVFFAELLPVWGFDAPKAWLAARLLWDVDASPDMLLAHFYEGFYGPAAEPMQAFFEEAEQIWMSQPGKSRWIRWYKELHQGLLFDPAACARLEALLDRAAELATEEPYGHRVGLAVEAFTATRALVDFLPHYLAAARWTPEDGVEALEDMADAYTMSRAHLAAVQSQLLSTSTVNRWPHALEYPFTYNPLENRRSWVAGGHRNLLSARSADLDKWAYDEWPGSTAIHGHTDAGYKVAGARDLRFGQTFAARGGRSYSVAFEADGQLDPSCTVRLALRFLDKDGKHIGGVGDRLPPGSFTDALLVVATQIPSNARWVHISIDVYHQQPGDWVVLRPIE